jgi:hypothetical protein
MTERKIEESTKRKQSAPGAVEFDNTAHNKTADSLQGKRGGGKQAPAKKSELDDLTSAS